MGTHPTFEGIPASIFFRDTWSCFLYQYTSMSKFSTLEYVLIAALLVVVALSGYFTLVRLLYGTRHTSYDAWIFGVNIALLLQIYDNHCDANRK